MSPPPVRFGLVGCGRLAELGYVPAFAALDAAVLVAVADPDAGRRDHVARLVEGPDAPDAPVATHADAAALVAATAVDVVVVASPVECHLADAAACADAGIATLVEKPPAPSADGARDLAALAPRPWVGFNRRFDLGNRRVRAVVPAAGPVDVVVRLAYRRASWRAHAVHDDAWLDLGPHVVDLAAWLTAGTVHEVRDVTLEPERARATLGLDRGRASLEVACDRPYRELVEVRDDRGALLARHTLGGPVAAVQSRLRPGPHPLVATLTAQLAAVVRTVRGAGRGALADARDAARVMTVLDAARTAASTGRAVTLDPEDPACS